MRVRDFFLSPSDVIDKERAPLLEIADLHCPAAKGEIVRWTDLVQARLKLAETLADAIGSLLLVWSYFAFYPKPKMLVETGSQFWAVVVFLLFIVRPILRIRGKAARVMDLESGGS